MGSGIGRNFMPSRYFVKVFPSISQVFGWMMGWMDDIGWMILFTVTSFLK
jgi:hypothetical protein